MLSCRESELPQRDGLLGGAVSVDNQSPLAFSQPAPGLTNDEELLFFVGNSFFNQNWVSAPASTTARDGLGPLFNARSCSGCHLRDGRGAPPQSIGLGDGLLLRLGIPDGSSGLLPDPMYGFQLQTGAIGGVPAEGQFQIIQQALSGSFADGTTYSLLQPEYQLVNLAYGVPDPGTRISPRIAPQVIGMGLLEAIEEADLIALSDPGDLDGDGISGRLNTVWDEPSGAYRSGRFGWKAGAASISHQVASAFLHDMGITSALFPMENCLPAQVECHSAPNGGVPEIDPDDFDKVVLYNSTLAVPFQRNPNDAGVIAGEEIFREIGCANCHAGPYRTGWHPIAVLSNQAIRPYTDLLLHDMGEDLADNRPEAEADGREWRTPPLWGIGLFATVNGHTRYLHDGRARNLEEAILWHGGEALPAQSAYRQLSTDQRNQLLTFLQSL